MSLSCPCCSGNAYAACCKPLHEGLLPVNALALMRSRYAAFALNLPDYLIATTHPAGTQYSEHPFLWKRQLSQFSQRSSFEGLEILAFQENATLATVTFTAHLSQDGKDATFTEKSYFEKFRGRWLYRNGQIAAGRVIPAASAGPLRLLPLAYYGAAVLRQKAEAIPRVTSEIQDLVIDMVETMDAFNAMGIAAPQVYSPLRLFVIRKPIEEPDTGRLDLGAVEVFINPTLSAPSAAAWSAPEGCLSIPNLRASVERPKEITVEYTSLEGQRCTQRFTGWEARVIMHENDHINGVLFVDRMDSEEKKKSASVLKNIEQRLKQD